VSASLLGYAALLANAPVHAQAPSEAERLFQQGRAALEAKDYATACAKLAASQRLDAAVGTLISLAECEEDRGQLAGARAHWQEAANLAEATHDKHDRAVFARERLAQLEPRVPRLTLRVSTRAPKGMIVMLDGLPLGETDLGLPRSLDPGTHAVQISATGHAPRTLRVDLTEGQRRELDLEPGEAIAAAPPPPQEPLPREPPPTTPAPTPERGSWHRPVAYAAGGLGVVGIAVGSVLGLEASSKWSKAKQDCGAGCPSGSIARSERSDASTDGTISTVGFVAGGVALAAGIVLYLTAPSSTPSSTSARVTITPYAGPWGEGVLLSGAF
jgi:hypothetical protein